MFATNAEGMGGMGVCSTEPGTLLAAATELQYLAAILVLYTQSLLCPLR
jgi:hypothetical protein